MLLKSAEIYARLMGESADHKAEDPLSIVPCFRKEALKNSGTASIDLRLGRWFLSLRSDRTPLLEVKEKPSQTGKEYNKLPVRQTFVPFGAKFYVQPGAFVLVFRQ